MPSYVPLSQGNAILKHGWLYSALTLLDNEVSHPDYSLGLTHLEPHLLTNATTQRPGVLPSQANKTSAMKLVIIDSHLVDEEPDNYDSNFHSAEDAPGLGIPNEKASHFKRWLPLILRSQNIDPNKIQTICLSQSQGRLLLDAAQSSLHTRKLNGMYAEELADDIVPVFSKLIFPPEGLFLRLDSCSPKDGTGTTKPLRTTEEIILRLTTSHRAMRAVTDLLRRDIPSIDLIFLPHNDRMKPDHEFRVFCAPPLAKIRGVSQYRWHEPFVFRGRPMDEVEDITKKVMKGIELIREEILEEAKTGKGGELDALVPKQGFTFDVIYDELTGKTSLIELNSFGARSGCGSCLFHWIRDRNVLYRENFPIGDVSENIDWEVEFRISM
ncbi:hypothetical protein B7463_g2606, partial [Scytalidium lignicola]